MNRVRLLWGLSAVTILALLAACGPAQTPQPQVIEKVVTKEVVVKETVVVESTPEVVVKEVTAEPLEKVTVTWWNEQPIDKVQRFMDSFNAHHDDIVLEMTAPEDLETALNPALAAGEGPDIFSSNGPSWTMEYEAAGHLLDLTPYAEKYGWQDKLMPWAYQASLIKGKLYSIPLTYETLVLYYNKDLFQKQGWTPPTSLDEINAICEAATKAGIWCFSHGGGGSNNHWYSSVYYSHYAGADKVYEALTHQRRWDDPLFQEATQLMKDQVDRGWWAGSAENYFSFGWGDYQSNFCQGLGAMFIAGTWAFNFIDQYCQEADTEVKWDWVPIPPMRKGVQPVYDLAVGTSLSINAKSKNPDAAAAVLDWLLNDKARALAQAREFNFGEFLVPLRYTPDNFPSDIDPRVLRYLGDVTKAMDEGQIGYAAWTFIPIKSDTYIKQELPSVFVGKLSPEAFLTELQRLFDEEFQEGRVPTAPPTSAKSPD